MDVCLSFAEHKVQSPFHPGHCSLVTAVHEHCRTDCSLLIKNNRPPARHAQECTVMQNLHCAPSTDVSMHCTHLEKKSLFCLQGILALSTQISVCFILKLWSTEGNIANFSMDQYLNSAVCFLTEKHQDSRHSSPCCYCLSDLIAVFVANL